MFLKITYTRLDTFVKGNLVKCPFLRLAGMLLTSHTFYMYIKKNAIIFGFM